MIEQVPAIAKAAGSTLKVAPGIFAAVKRLRADIRDARSFKESLGLVDKYAINFRVAMNHPLLQSGVPHPDDFDALSSVLGSDMPKWDQVEVPTSDIELTSPLSDSFVLIGSPESETMTRLAFGYRKLPAERGVEFVGSGIELPFRWEEDARRVKAIHRKYVGGRGLVERPNWPILDERGKQAKSIFPELDGRRFLKTDLLLITKIPNYFTDEGFQSRRSLISIGGAHGTATRAIGILLKNRRMMADLHREIRHYQGFQIICQVTDIRHDISVGSRANTIEIREVVPIEHSDAEWRAVRLNLRKRALRWDNEMLEIEP